MGIVIYTERYFTHSVVNHFFSAGSFETTNTPFNEGNTGRYICCAWACFLSCGTGKSAFSGGENYGHSII